MFAANHHSCRQSLRGLYLPALIILTTVSALPLYALDNVGGQDYAQIGPVMCYDPCTAQSTPFLPIGWYFWWPHSGPLLDEVLASGANTVVFTSCADDPSWLFTHAQAGMDRAEELGLKVILGFAPSMLMGVNYNDPPSYAHLIPWLLEFKNHPALLGWQLGDENGGPVTAQMVNDTARVVRRNDPLHQIWQVFSLHHNADPADGNLIGYMEQTDVSSFDRYGYYDWVPTFGAAAWIIELQNEKAGLGAAHGWAGNVNVVQGYGNDTGTVFPEMRFPSYDEYRHLVFSAFASAGARGTLSWVYYYDDLNWYTSPAVFTNWRDTVCRPIQLEQQMIAHAMATGWNVGQVNATTDGIFITGPSGGQYATVSHLLTYDDIQQLYYLIVTNNSFDTTFVELTLTQLPDPITSLTAEIPESGATVVMEHLGNGDFRLSDTLANHEVKVYRLRADGIPASCGALGTVYLDADLVPDCYVNIIDYAQLTAQWMHCTNPTDPCCDPYWDNGAGANPPVTATDDFTYPDGSLSAQPDWIRRGDKTEWLVSNQTAVTEGNASGAVNAVWFQGLAHTTQTYQKAAVDFSFNANMVDYGGWLCLFLNQDWANSGFYCNLNGYKLQIRGRNDFLLAKNVNDVDVLSAGWIPFTGNLIPDTTYRAQLEKDGPTLTATVYQGTTVVGTSSLTDTQTNLTGGHVGLIGYYQTSAHGYVLDNFEYQINSGGPQFCGDQGTVFLDADLAPDCYVNLADLAAFVSQWLWCSNPNESNCDQYWQ